MGQLAAIYWSSSNKEKTERTVFPIAEGLRKNGWEIEKRESLRFPQGDESKFSLAAVWGDTAKALDILDSPAFPLRVQIDNGYLRRERWTGYYSLSWGGQRQCHEYLWQSPRCPERFSLLNETIQPWRKDGKGILLLAPSVKQGKILGFDTDLWARRMQDAISRHTKRRIVVSIKRYPNSVPLRQLLKEEPIFAAVGYNTKGLVECLLDGIPIFPLSPCAAYSMGLNDIAKIETPFYPNNRQEFFERLSGTQWLLSEVAEGIPFREPFFPPPIGR